MSAPVFNGRIQFRADTLENWLKADDFVPLDGELIIVENAILAENTQTGDENNGDKDL